MAESQQHSNQGGSTMGRGKLIIEGQARHTHFTWEQRIQLQYYYTGTNGYKKIRSPVVLGKISGKHESTILMNKSMNPAGS
jgi:hypothetical protein